MKRFLKTFVLIFTVFSVVTTKEALAIGLMNPVGGKIVSNVLPSVVCPGGKGPITITPVALFPPVFYAVTPLTKSYSHDSTAPLSWIIGLYAPLSPIFCHIPTPLGPVPFPVFPLILFGSSKPGL